MSFMKIGDIEGGDAGFARFKKGEFKNSLVIEIQAINDNIVQYLFLDSIDADALREYLKEEKG